MSCSKSHLYLFQFSDMFGEQIYLPYSVGLVWAYARTVPEVAASFANRGFVFVREDPAMIASRLDNPGVVAFSTYVWNWEMSVAVAREVKTRFPDCLVVVGGPQVPNPDRLNGLFERYPFIDIAVHGEGEVTFAEILQCQATDRDFSRVKGITHRGRTTEPRPRSVDPNAFPSPYLAGIFDDLFELPYEYNAVWESNRGCPYGCTFCDWGSIIQAKLATFDDERLLEEIAYFAARKISHVYLADANFGIIPRDVDIAKQLARTKACAGGFPARVRVNYAKSSPRRVHEIAKILNAMELDKGITLSVQSMGQTALDIVRRKNLKCEVLASWMQQYQRDGIHTYTELIAGLPGETYDTFCDGLETLLEAGAHDSIWVYRCTVLVNSTMNDPAYREQHGIRSVRMPSRLIHAPHDRGDVVEYEDIAVETATLNRTELQRLLLLAWALQAYHSMGLVQVFAMYAKEYCGLRYTAFYEALLRFAAENPDTVVGREWALTAATIDSAIERGGWWDSLVPEMSDSTWRLEEATHLRTLLRFGRFYQELESFLDGLVDSGAMSLEPRVREDLEAYQKAIVVNWWRDEDNVLELGHSVHGFHRGVLTGSPAELRPGRFRTTVRNRCAFGGDRRRYAKEIVFWGRRAGRTVHRAIEERELDARRGGAEQQPGPGATARLRG